MQDQAADVDTGCLAADAVRADLAAGVEKDNLVAEISDQAVRGRSLTGVGKYQC